ncbi:oxygenase MpaB family protein [Nocardioides marmoribigeumensis]|uniref:Uncharacterized protein (DUF2236 family) n=1 Tax=Nocardioides marmoribigeumensis TaxID=433649 RepID=A0ABU2BVB3_9ACTN|nr:oxygenase MpaB family protein [Nocardioides marmoribigeumensis]MDR7362560.1 uncharacterized protein (DUF2236 family) [Nocardioides marmoribigeumensis]
MSPAPPTSTSRRRAPRSRDVPVPPGFEMRRHMSGLGSQLAGNANVVMQLSRPEVGYGVMNSRVHSGSALRHPVKRARTTFTYLAVSMLGTDEERAIFRRAVNGQHAQVTSTPEEPVSYRATDPELQRWVAACLYAGTRDIAVRLHGPLDPDEADALYAHCARYGTTLQMPAEAWPEDRAAFETYWAESLGKIHVDDAVRAYLVRLLTMGATNPVGRLVVGSQLFATRGFLPHEFRRAMGLPWSSDDERRFERLVRRAGRLERLLPLSFRALPFDLLLADLRWRHRTGRPLV